MRHRLTFFFERIKFLESKYGVPDKVVLEFVRDDFMGEKEKKEMRIAMKKRAEEKMRIAKDLDEHGFKAAICSLKWNCTESRTESASTQETPYR